jgi:hypothetical protein
VYCLWFLQIAADEHREIHEKLYGLQLKIFAADPDLDSKVRSVEGQDQLRTIEELACLALCYHPTCYNTWDVLASEFRSDIFYQNRCLSNHPEGQEKNIIINTITTFIIIIIIIIVIVIVMLRNIIINITITIITIIIIDESSSMPLTVKANALRIPGKSSF